MTDLSTLTHDQLAEHIRAGLLEAEARLTADGSASPRPEARETRPRPS